MLKALCTDSRTHRKSAEKSGQDAEQASVSCLKNGLQNGRCQACEQVGKAGGKKETGQNHERKQSRNHFGEPECQTVGGERSGLRRKAQQKQTQDRKGSEKEKEKQLSAHGFYQRLSEYSILNSMWTTEKLDREEHFDQTGQIFM